MGTIWNISILQGYNNFFKAFLTYFLENKLHDFVPLVIASPIIFKKRLWSWC
jgi:hypothetical protein